MKLLVLYTALAGYMTACLGTFRRVTDATLLTYAWPTETDAPFSEAMTAGIGEIRNRAVVSPADIVVAGHKFAPDAVLVSGWMDKGYLRAARAFRRLGIPVIAGCDTQWTGALRQRIAAFAAPIYLHTAFDALWVTGERQAAFAHALGYRGDRCWDGFYACDWDRFAAAPPPAGDRESPPSFLYVGRYVPEKGITTLAAAYARYRAMVDRPWPLVCAGAGPQRAALVAAGALDHGFVQPAELPGLMANASALILPSIREPWGVVLQEAAAAGLPLIASRACGAAVHLLRDGFNGNTFPPEDTAALARAMTRLHESSAADRTAMGAASRCLSRQYTPELWAQQLHNGIARLRERSASLPR